MTERALTELQNQIEAIRREAFAETPWRCKRLRNWPRGRLLKKATRPPRQMAAKAVTAR
jgi:hypothetical protein